MLILYENGREVCQLIGGELPHPRKNSVGTTGVPARYSSLSLDPALLLVGASGLASLLPWVSAVLRSVALRKDLELVSYDALTRKGVRSQMHECLLKTIVFPALDRSSKADASLKLSVLPERMNVTNQPSTTGISLARAAGLWKVSDFVIDIPGIPGLGDAIQSVGALDVTQLVKASYVGAEDRRMNDPTGTKQGNLILTMSSSKAAPVTEWAGKQLLGDSREKSSLQGTLSYLSGKKPLFTLEFSGIGIVQAIISGNMPRLELFYEKLDLRA